MRWLGAARRAHDVAVDYAARREAFGGPLGEHRRPANAGRQRNRHRRTCAAADWRACWELDQGAKAANSTSIAKTFAAEAIGRIVDRWVQMCGGLGVYRGPPVARLSREVRPFRVYDGPSEVHRWSVGRKAVERTGGASGEKSA